MLLLVLALAQAPIELKPGMVITQSARVVPKTYQLSGPPIVVRGDDITVDFRGATLQGSAADTAIRVEGGRNVRLINAKIHGYKVGILARGTQHLVLEQNDLSRNWRPRLFSLVEHESLVDWLSFHHNEKGEWLRFGAAIYLEDVKGAQLRNNVAVAGMNGLLMVRSDGAMVRDNNFSFNSGLGIGLYRSSYDSIIHNRLDYNVRGYSHGFYSRGQDSADLLLYEQSSHNYVAYNSLTHGGDGVFLWAGQTTMDSGTGGANDNVFLSNDVSYATANGIEATFSRNMIIGNRAWGSEYGIWAGYSFETWIIENDFRFNRTGIAIEHGQNNAIYHNRFDRDSTAIRLWADSIAPSDWGYPKHRDTRSRDYYIGDNVFNGHKTVLNIRNTTGVDSGKAVPVAPPRPITALDRLSPPSSDLSRTDRSSIIVDEWGPYDWTTPRLWPVDSTRAVPLRLRTLGPEGSWRLVSRRGIAALSRTSGRIGDTVAVTPAADSLGDWELTLESRGQRFSYGRFEPKTEWTYRLGTIDTTRADTTWGEPRTASRLDLMWYRPPRRLAGWPAEHWLLDASATVTLAPGEYSIRTISDDAVRVWVDDSLVIDNWTPHESLVDYAAIAPGTHRLRVLYYQKDGWVELRVEIVRGSERDAGSPGPH